MSSETAKLTSYSFSADASHLVLGFSDGSVQSIAIDFATSFPDAQQLGVDSLSMKPGERVSYEDGVLELTPQGQLRLQRVELEKTPAESLETDQAIVLVDRVEQSNASVYASVDAAGVFRIPRFRQRRNLMTGELTRSVDGGSLALNLESSRGLPDFLELEGRADSVLLIWKDGFALRLDTRDRSEPKIAEQLQLLPPYSAELTQVTMLNGDMTLVAGDAVGTIRAWFRYRPGDASNAEVATTSDLSTLRLSAVFLLGILKVR